MVNVAKTQKYKKQGPHRHLHAWDAEKAAMNSERPNSQKEETCYAAKDTA